MRRSRSTIIVYEDGGKQNDALFDIARGTIAFVAAAVAKTGDMKISTPTATLGIRGTTGLVEVPQDASAASANNVAIKLYPDPDGRVGHIDVSDRNGARLGSLTQGASGFTIRPGAGGRFTAAPLVISPQQALRDQGIVRQVHAAQSVGRADRRPSSAPCGRPIRRGIIICATTTRRVSPACSGRTVCRSNGRVCRSSVKACRNSVRVCRTGQASRDNRSHRACSDKACNDRTCNPARPVWCDPDCKGWARQACSAPDRKTGLGSCNGGRLRRRASHRRSQSARTDAVES